MSKSSSRGGARSGAGRSRGSGKYGEPTRTIRVPQRLHACVQRLLAELPQASSSDLVSSSGYQFYQPATAPPLELPLYATKVATGFPSPADDYVKGQLDLNSHLVKHPAALFFVQVASNSMVGASTHLGDILMVDRSPESVDGKIVI